MVPVFHGTIFYGCRFFLFLIKCIIVGNYVKYKNIKLFYDYHSFNIKNALKIWLSAKTQYLSAFSRKQTHQFTTYLLPLNEPWYASFPRYAKIWYSTSVLKQEKIE